MEMAVIELMQDFSEIVHYGHTGIPLYIRTADLAAYPGMSAPCHWHDDIEWIFIISGKMCYYINGKRILLNEKDSLMVKPVKCTMVIHIKSRIVVFYVFCFIRLYLAAIKSYCKNMLRLLLKMLIVNTFIFMQNRQEDRR